MTGRLVVVLLLLLGNAYAQFNTGSAVMTGRVRVRIWFADHAACDPSTLVALIANDGFTFAENAVDGHCVAEFFDVRAGNYHVKVTGAGVASADNADFTLSPGMTQDLEVRVRHTGSFETEGLAVAAFVSVSDLSVPATARKEFEKATHLISKQDWVKAKERLSKAIAVYPQYAAAYNNLGAVCSHMGDIGQAREALQKAVSLDDHMALAYVNLGRVSFSIKDFPEVETFIGKALSLAAPDAEQLKLLAYAQLADHHFDQAIETSRQAHRLQLSHHAFLHVLAAKANELKSKSDDSIAELQQYLREEPTGPRAEKIRNVLAAFQAQAITR
jgi:tetratricopeptide (TPR) repeat protein